MVSFVAIAAAIWQGTALAQLEPKAVSSLLDGKTFHGEIVDEKGKVEAKDVVTFRDGKFRSAVCADLGIAESPYFVRTEGETTHFLVEAGNQDTGTMVFRGIVRGEQAEWRGVWSKDRWYWRVRREVQFKGVTAR
jgi:hypothetical protein